MKDGNTESNKNEGIYFLFSHVPRTVAQQTHTHTPYLLHAIEWFILCMRALWRFENKKNTNAKPKPELGACSVFDVIVALSTCNCNEHTFHALNKQNIFKNDNNIFILYKHSMRTVVNLNASNQSDSRVDCMQVLQRSSYRSLCLFTST